MESIPTCPLLKFNSDTLQEVRREYNLDKPGRMAEAIDILDEWVKKQNHFVKRDFSRAYLERTIITTKGSMERAKLRLDRYCTFKSMMPNFFSGTDVENEFKDLKQFGTHAHLPKITEDNYRVYIFKLLRDIADPELILKYYKYILVLSEYAKRNEYCNGYILVLDFSDVSIMSFVAKINVMEMRHALTILMEGYGMRIKGIHFVAPSKTIDALISIFKSVVSEKISNRIHIHKTVDTLYEYVPRDVLPTEYGGNEKALKTLQDEWFKEVSSKEFEKYLQEIHQAKTNESCRQTDKFNAEYIGMPGSFRTLSVD